MNDVLQHSNDSYHELFDNILILLSGNSLSVRIVSCIVYVINKFHAYVNDSFFFFVREHIPLHEHERIRGKRITIDLGIQFFPRMIFMCVCFFFFSFKKFFININISSQSICLTLCQINPKYGNYFCVYFN